MSVERPVLPRALVVDDDEPLLRAHARALFKGGYRVEMARDGSAALSALALLSFA
jgi:ActR/RegA family two-component response regulator